MTPTKQPEVWAIARLREALAKEPGGPEVTITTAVAVALLDLRATPPQVADPVEGWPEVIYLQPECPERCWCVDKIEDDWQEYRLAYRTPRVAEADEGEG